jgi:hypothetical protein
LVGGGGVLSRIRRIDRVPMAGDPKMSAPVPPDVDPSTHVPTLGAPMAGEPSDALKGSFSKSS